MDIYSYLVAAIYFFYAALMAAWFYCYPLGLKYEMTHAGFEQKKKFIYLEILVALIFGAILVPILIRSIFSVNFISISLLLSPVLVFSVLGWIAAKKFNKKYSAIFYNSSVHRYNITWREKNWGYYISIITNVLLIISVVILFGILLITSGIQRF